MRNIEIIKKNIFALMEALSNEEAINYYHNQKENDAVDYASSNKDNNIMEADSDSVEIAKDVLLHTIYIHRTIPVDKGSFKNCPYVEGVIVFKLNKYSNGFGLSFFIVPKQKEDEFRKMIKDMFDISRLEYRDEYFVDNDKYLVYSLLSEKE